MRKVALVKNGRTDVRQVIAYEADGGVYLFPCASLEGGSATGDQWIESTAEAAEYCKAEFGIEDIDWRVIADPPEGCQQDWIAPVRVKGRNGGNPKWGQLERLEDGEWRDIT